MKKFYLTNARKNVSYIDHNGKIINDYVFIQATLCDGVYIIVYLVYFEILVTTCYRNKIVKKITPPFK